MKVLSWHTPLRRMLNRMLDEVHTSHTRDKVKPTIAVRCNGDEDKKSKAGE